MSAVCLTREVPDLHIKNLVRILARARLQPGLQNGWLSAGTGAEIQCSIQSSHVNKRVPVFLSAHHTVQTLKDT